MPMEQQTAGPSRWDPVAWARFAQQARDALLARFRAQPQLSPADVAATVAAALPPAAGRWLLARLHEHGWLADGARVECDALTPPRCPPEFRGPPAEVVRLAVFGLPGQGLTSRDKHRDGLYQQLCAEILRTAVDPMSLQTVARRTLNHPDVQSDMQLHSMLQTFIAQRETALRAARVTPDEEFRQRSESSKLRDAYNPTPGADVPTRASVLGSFLRLRGEFEGALARFDEKRAQKVLRKMQDLRRHFPVHIVAEDLQATEEQLDRLLKQTGTYRRQIGELAARGMQAASDGDGKTAVWIVRRLYAIHSLLPSLLPADRLERLQNQIERYGDQADSREAIREFQQREVQVATEIRELAGVIHRFHELARREDPDVAKYQRAEADYREAVARIRALDTDWLAGLMLQLETLLDDLEDPGGAMHNQFELFIARVRDALNRLRLEVRAIQAETGKAPPPPSAN